MIKQLKSFDNRTPDPSYRYAGGKKNSYFDSISKASHNTNKRVTIKENESQIF